MLPSAYERKKFFLLILHVTIEPKNSKNMKRALFYIFLLCYQLLNASLQWSNPTTISSPQINASDPQIVIDSQGNATAAWIENGIIQTASRPYNSNWSSPQPITATGASSPKLDIDSTGNVTVIWIANNTVLSATLPFQGSWSSSTTISKSGAASIKLAVDDIGNAVAVWTRNGFIESAKKPFGKTWQASKVISSIGNDSNPDIAIAHNGQIVAVWHTVVSGRDTIYAATSEINKNWTPSRAILPPDITLHYDYPTIAIDPFGNASAAWFSYNLTGSIYSNVGVMTASLPFGTTTWSQPTTLSSNGLRNPQNLQAIIQFDSNGNEIILWSNSFDGDTFNICSSILSNNNWNTVTIVDNVYAFQADIAVDSSGNTAVIYMYYNNPSITIQSTETNISSITQNYWSIPQYISQNTNNGYPRLTYSSKGTSLYAAAVWIQFNGTNSTLQASTGIRNSIAPPTNLSISQQMKDYGIFQDYYNILNWTASTDPNISAYAIYRNGIFLFTVDANTFQFIDHNALQNGPVTYGISAINMNNNCSPIVTVSLP